MKLFFIFLTSFLSFFTPFSTSKKVVENHVLGSDGILHRTVSSSVIQASIIFQEDTSLIISEEGMNKTTYKLSPLSYDHIFKSYNSGSSSYNYVYREVKGKSMLTITVQYKTIGNINSGFTCTIINSDAIGQTEKITYSE